MRIVGDCVTCSKLEFMKKIAENFSKKLNLLSFWKVFFSKLLKILYKALGKLFF